MIRSRTCRLAQISAGALPSSFIDVLELSVNGNAFRGVDHLSLRVNGQMLIDQAILLSRGAEVVSGLTSG